MSEVRWWMDYVWMVVAARLPVGRRLAMAGPAGQSLVEYALVIGVIALLAIAGLTAFGNGISQLFSSILSRVTGAVGGGGGG